MITGAGNLRSFLPIVLLTTSCRALGHPGSTGLLGLQVYGICPQFAEVPSFRNLESAAVCAELSPLQPWAFVPGLGERTCWAGSRTFCPVPVGPDRVRRSSPADLVTDLDFSPFDDFLLATGSADGTVSRATERAARCLTHSWLGSSEPAEPLGLCFAPVWPLPLPLHLLHRVAGLG